MRESIPLGRIAGIRIGANWSVLAILAFITFALAAWEFPTDVPGLPWIAYATAGLTTGVVFLLSLLAHEISHALVARRNGIHVEGITLWLFGGVAKLEDDADTPGADLRIAGVGPLVSALLAGLFFGGWLLVNPSTGPALVAAALSWLALINIALAVFNLVPAAPLDGGRLLRSALWRRSGNRHRAASTAAGAGRIFGMVLIGLGIVELILLPRIIGALWLALIGWFLMNAAGAEQRYARQQQRLTGIQIAHVMSPQPFTPPPELSIKEFADRYAAQYRFSSFPLAGSDGRFAGLATLEQLQAVPREDRPATRLVDIALEPSDVPTARPDEPLSEVMFRRAGKSREWIVVVDDEQRVVGIASPTDISRARPPTDRRGPARPSQT